MRPQRWSRPTPGRGRCARRRSVTRRNSFERCRAYFGSIPTRGHCARRRNSGNSLYSWPSARPNRRPSWRGWVLAMQGPSAAGLAQLHQGMAIILATGQTLSRPYCLVLLAEAAGYAGQVEEGLRLLAEALAAFEASGRGDMLTEAYRL